MIRFSDGDHVVVDIDKHKDIHAIVYHADGNKVMLFDVSGCRMVRYVMKICSLGKGNC